MFRFAAAALIALAPACVTQAATIVADYQVQNVYTSSVGTIGALTPINSAGVGFTPNATVGSTSQTVLTISAGVSGSVTTPSADTSGVQAQTAGFVSSTNYSAVLLANFPLTANLLATKVLDFKNQSADAGLYINDVTGLLSFNGAGTPPPIGGTAVVPNAYTQIVLTRNSATNLVSVYQAGVLAFNFTDTSGLAVLGDATNTGNAYLTVFKDDTANVDGGLLTSESTEGNIARLRLYNGVFTAGEVAGLDTTVPEPATVLTAMTLAGLLRRRVV